MVRGRVDTTAPQTRARRSGLIAAIVVGLVAGALMCTGVTGPAHAQANEVGEPARSSMAQPAATDVHAAHASHTPPAGSTNDHEMPTHHHAGMACLVDIDLRVADLDVAIVAEPNGDPDTSPTTSQSFGPEPPVPRPTS